MASQCYGPAVLLHKASQDVHRAAPCVATASLRGSSGCSVQPFSRQGMCHPHFYLSVLAADAVSPQRNAKYAWLSTHMDSLFVLRIQLCVMLLDAAERD